MFDSVGKVLGESAQDADWLHRASAAAHSPVAQSLISALAVEPVPDRDGATNRYVVEHVFNLRLLPVVRQIRDLKSKLQRTNPVEHPTKYNQMFSELVVLEAQRKQLQARSLGEP